MCKNPKITIVTPTYNAANDIEACLLSVANQTYQDKEHLIIDGASTDGTLEIVKRYTEKYSHIKFTSEKDNGIYDAMNKAIDLASGDWIYFLGCDDVFYNDTILEEVFNALEVDSFDVIYGNVLWGDTDKIYDGKFSLLKLMDKNICHQAIFCKKSIFTVLGKFDTNYKAWADYLFNIKWFNSDEVRSKYISTIVAKYGINGYSSQMADADFIRDRESIYKQNFPVEYILIREKLHSYELEIDQNNHLIVDRERQLAERDQRLAELNQRLAQRDQQLAERVQALNDCNKQLNVRIQHIKLLNNSLSWKITAPIRTLADYFINSSKQFKRSFSSKLELIISKYTAIRMLVVLLLDFIRTKRRLPELKEYSQLISRAVQLRDHRGEIVADPYDAWLAVNHWNPHVEQRLRNRLHARGGALPKISVVMPVYNPPFEFLERAIDSVVCQTYDNWELCISDDASTDSKIRPWLQKLAASNNKVQIVFRPENGNISRATNSAAELVSGDFIVFLDQDDELSPDALGEVALYIAEHPETDFLYSDDDKIDMDGRRFAPQFKPDWSPELLLSYMYCSHLVAVRRELYNRVGGTRIGFEGSQDYDFALRATEEARHVGHIPLILYHWRVLPTSTAHSAHAKPGSMDAGRRAVQSALDRRGIDAKAYQPDWAVKTGVGMFSHKFELKEYPSVTILIPTKNQEKVLKRCIDSIFEKTTYPNYKVLIIDNDSDNPESLRYLEDILKVPNINVVRISNPTGKFNFSFINNRAAEIASTDYILFLNNDTEILKEDWLNQMVGYAKIKGVGAVGARLLFPDKTVQHAGVVLKFYCGMAGHAFKGLPDWDLGYLGYSKVLRNYTAVTAACMLTPRKLFLDMGGFDEINFAVAYNDVDYCGRLLDKKYRVVYTPEAELTHHEGYTRGYVDDPKENVNFRNKFYRIIDRYYSSSLSVEDDHFKIQPRRIFTGNLDKSVKTLMCSHNLNHEGAPYHIYELSVGLKQKGIMDPIVFSPIDGPLRKLYESHGIKVIINEHLGSTVNIQEYEKRVEEFVSFIKSLGIDLVYANTILNFYAVDAAKKTGLPSLWNIHESEPWQYYIDQWGNRLASEARKCFAYPYKIIFVAHSTQNGYMSFNATRNFTVIHNGLDLQRINSDTKNYDRDSLRNEMGITVNNLMILLPGTICERKGQQDLIRALNQISAECLQNLKCFIVGARPENQYSDEFVSLIESLPEDTRKRVNIIPATSEIFKYYMAADIFVCTSRIESFPRVVLEAMAFDLPIITTPVFGISEQVQAGVNAVFYNPGDIGYLAKGIEYLVTDNKTRKLFSENSKYVLQQLVNFEEMVDSYGKIFQEAYLTGSHEIKG